MTKTSLRRILKIKFVDFWPTFNYVDNPISFLLGRKYNLVPSESPDILVYSVFGRAHEQYRCAKLLFSAECTVPNFDKCDYSFTPLYLDDPRHYRLPPYTFYGAAALAQPKPQAETILHQKKYFCCMVVSNPSCEQRNEMFKRLSSYKLVHSGGRHLNNIGRTLDESLGTSAKRAFIKDYKFVLSFENRSYAGYTTEKIIEPMIMNSIPIYWGNPLIHTEFNPKSFVNCHEFQGFAEVIDNIMHLDQDDSLYLNMLRQPWLHDNVLPDSASVDSFATRLEHIIAKLGFAN